MARIRSIKPDFWTDEKVVELSFAARLLFIGLWNFADDEGRMVYSEKRIKMQILPADNIDITEILDEIRGAGIIQVYNIAGVQYLQVVNFKIHQKVDKRLPSKFPPLPDLHIDSPRVTPTEWNGMEGKRKGRGREEEGIDPPNPQGGMTSIPEVEDLGNAPTGWHPRYQIGLKKPVKSLTDFEIGQIRRYEEFSDIFPKKRYGSHEKAYRAFCKANDQSPATDILAGARAYAGSWEVAKQGGQFIKGAAAWLNDAGWMKQYEPNTGEKHAIEQKQHLTPLERQRQHLAATTERILSTMPSAQGHRGGGESPDGGGVSSFQHDEHQGSSTGG